MRPCLLVLPTAASPETGTGQRSLMLLEAAARGGPVHIVLLDGAGPVEAMRHLPGVASVRVLPCRRLRPRTRLFQRLIGPSRLLLPRLAYRADPALAAAIQALITEVSARLVVFRYAETYCAAGIEARPGFGVIVDVDDRDDQKYASRLARLFGDEMPERTVGQWCLGRMARVLKRRLAQASLVLFAAEEDLWPLAPAATAVVPNVAYDAPALPPPLDAGSRTLLFVGNERHMPNRDGVGWFVREVWARVRARVPDARLRVVGVGGWPAFGSGIGAAPGVTFVGRVADLGGEYAGARACICPVREGGGSKIKLIEAAAFARPVIATRHALRGLDTGLSGAVAADDTAEGQAALAVRYLTDYPSARDDGVTLRKRQTAYCAYSATLDRIDRSISFVSPR